MYCVKLHVCLLCTWINIIIIIMFAFQRTNTATPNKLLFIMNCNKFSLKLIFSRYQILTTSRSSRGVYQSLFYTFYLWHWCSMTVSCNEVLCGTYPNFLFFAHFCRWFCICIRLIILFFPGIKQQLNTISDLSFTQTFSFKFMYNMHVFVYPPITLDFVV